MTSLVTREEFFRHGPGPEVWEPLARRVAQLDVTTNRILLPSHGCSNDDPLTVVAGPAIDADGEFPAGLSAFVVYYARVVGSSLLELAASAGGAAVDFGPGEGTFGLELHFDLGPAIDQALEWASARFLACAAKNEWSEPISGWGGDIKDMICDLAAWPQLDRRGYKAEGKDGYRERYLLAVKVLEKICAGDRVPDGVVVEPETGDGSDFGSSGFGDDDRGYGGRASWDDRGRPTI